MADVENGDPSAVKVEESTRYVEDDDDDDEDLFGGDEEEVEEASPPDGVKKEEELDPPPAIPPVNHKENDKSSLAVVESEPPLAEQPTAAPTAIVTNEHLITSKKNMIFPADPPSSSKPYTAAPSPQKETVGSSPSFPHKRDAEHMDPESYSIPRKKTKNSISGQARNKESSLPATTPAPSPTPAAHLASSNSPAPASAPVATSANTSTTKHYSASRFGLPPSVKVPESVDPKLLEGAILTKLKMLPPNLVNDALQEYDDALQVKGTSIRNRGAYLFGVIKRYISVQERANSGEGPAILPMGEGLTPVVNARLETLVQTGFCTREEMNDKVRSKIRMLSEKDALFAIDELSSAERKTIRNFGSYFMGILNRYMRGESRSGNESSKERVTRFDRDNRDRGGSVFNSDPGPYGRGGGEDRKFRDSRDSGAYGQRDRPRDHHDEDRYRHYGNDSRGGNDPFAVNKNPGARWPQQAPPPPQMGGYNNMGTGMSGGPPPPPPPNTMGNNSYMQNQQQQPPYMQQQQPPNPYGGGQQGFQPQQQQPPMGTQSYNNNMAYQQQQQPRLGGQQSYNNNLGGQQPHNQFVPQPPQQQSYNPMGGGQISPQQQQQSYGNWQQPHQSTVPVDILALADKASSALMAVNRMNGGIAASVPGGFPPVHNRPPYPPSNQQQPPPPPPPPPASSVFNKSNTPPANPYGQHQPPSHPMQQQRQNQPQQNRNAPRHTIATMQDLPTSVQYAVQNLIATGQVEKAPDEGIMGMIFDLPENLALSALQKFTTIDKSQMRSRIAYLAGVLRRELEKINKR